MMNQVLLDFLNIGGSEFMIIAVVLLLLFGGKKLPELARGLGKGIREFNDASEGVKREIHKNLNAVTSDLSEQDEERINKNPLHPEEHATTASLESPQKVEDELPEDFVASRNAEIEQAKSYGQPQTERFIPADQLEAERIVAERLALEDRLSPAEQESLHVQDDDEEALKNAYK